MRRHRRATPPGASRRWPERPVASQRSRDTGRGSRRRASMGCSRDRRHDAARPLAARGGQGRSAMRRAAMRARDQSLLREVGAPIDEREQAAAAANRPRGQVRRKIAGRPRYAPARWHGLCFGRGTANFFAQEGHAGEDAICHRSHAMLTALVSRRSLAATPDLSDCDQKNASTSCRVAESSASPASCLMHDKPISRKPRSPHPAARPSPQDRLYPQRQDRDRARSRRCVSRSRAHGGAADPSVVATL